MRILVADEETIQVYDLKDEKWTATINQGFGGIRNVNFGRNQDEVIVFSDYQVAYTFFTFFYFCFAKLRKEITGGEQEGLLVV